jgi:superfamily II DNA or RNA helicase
VSPVITPFTLRPYQDAALAAVESGWSRGLLRPAVVAPTGDGKTVMFSELVRRRLAARGGVPAVFVHRDELAKQAQAKVHAMLGGSATVGIVKGQRNDVRADVLVCSVPTVQRAHRLRQLPALGLGIVDECHHAVADTWESTMRGLGAFDSTQFVGFTATMDREDGRHLGDIWEEVVFQRDVIDGIRSGSLVNPRGIRVQVEDLALDEVKRSRGDLQASDLGEAMLDADAGDAIARAYREHCPDRQGVIFAPTVATAYQFAQDMNEAGIATEVIEGQTPEDVRTDIYARFQSGQTQVLSNCMVLTEGWDAPWAEVAVIARPTQSAALYVQMAGRVLRPWPAGGKVDALILDVVGVSQRHPLATLANLSTSVANVRDGESLAEALDREAKEKAESGPAIPGEHRSLAGATLVSSLVDLFAGSSSVWLQTPGGVWFIPTRAGEFFLAPAHERENKGLFYVGHAPRRGQRGFQRVERAPMPMDVCMAWAEAYAEEADPAAAGKDTSWRNRPATSAKLAALDTLRVVYDRRTITQGQAYDLAATDSARRTLDKTFGTVRKGA